MSYNRNLEEEVQAYMFLHYVNSEPKHSITGHACICVKCAHTHARMHASTHTPSESICIDKPRVVYLANYAPQSPCMYYGYVLYVYHCRHIQDLIYILRLYSDSALIFHHIYVKKSRPNRMAGHEVEGFSV